MKMIKKIVMITLSCAILGACGDKKEKKKEGFTYEKKSEVKKEVKEELKVILTDEEVAPLLAKNTCVACHKKDQKVIGPSFAEIAKRDYSDQRIVELIYKPEPENWPEYTVPMVGLPFVPKGEALKIAGWINSLK